MSGHRGHPPWQQPGDQSLRNAGRRCCPYIPSGPILCIRGSGTLDLSQGLQFDRRNWNDQASAWWAGCSPGHFGENDTWWNPGAQQSFSGGAGTSAPSGNFTGQNGTLRNDSLTDVTLDSNC